MAGEILRVSRAVLSGDCGGPCSRSNRARAQRKDQKMFSPQIGWSRSFGNQPHQKTGCVRRGQGRCAKAGRLFGSQRPGAVRANRQFRWAIWWVMMVSRMQSATSAEKPSRGSTRTTAAQSVIGSSGRCCNVRQPPPQSAASRRQRHGKPPCRLTRTCFRARSFGSGSDG